VRSDPFLLVEVNRRQGTTGTIVEPFEDKVAAFIEANRLFAEDERILLAVSGGADSTALLHVMRKLHSDGIISGRLVCAHVNHQLRGWESDTDETFVTEQAEGLGLPVTSKRVDIQAYAAEHRLSTETAGRQVRLACLAEIAQVQGCLWVATGHQKDDNAETVIQRLRRGTGFRGLAGIWPVRPLANELRLARPLLGCTRAEIITYLRAKNLRWREDHTNTDCAYTRNYVRHRLLPALQSQSAGSLADAITELAVSAQRLHQRVGEQAKRAASTSVRYKNNTVSVEMKALAALPQIVAVELIRLQLPKLGCGERNLTRRHYEGLLRLASQSTGKHALTLPDSLSVRSERGDLVLQRRQPTTGPEEGNQDTVVDVPGTTPFAGHTVEARILSRVEIETAKIRRDKNPFVEYLDLDRVGRPLLVRRRQLGDRFRPLGLAGEKKVGKFLTAARVPDDAREDVLVFDDGEKIVWVCPARISEHVKVTEKTRRILMLSISDRQR
jgi:tRNA(Ile)-lysidine synthase